MKLQKKSILIFVVLLILVLAIMSVFFSTILLASYRALEEQYVTKDLNQAVNKLNDELFSMSAIASDWGPWDDSVDFVNGNAPNYLNSNLQPYSFDNLNMNLIVITNNNGEVIYSGAYDLRNNVMVSVPALFSDHLSLENPLMNMSDPRTVTKGILMLPDNPMLIVSQPIVRSDFSGPVQGVIIMGRFLDDAEISRLSTLTHPSLTFIPIDDSPQIRTIVSDIQQKSGPTPYVIQILSDDQVAGYAPVHDIYGNDVLILRITETRDIYHQGITTTVQVILIILSCGLILGIIVILLLDRVVLKRLHSLADQVNTIGKPDSTLDHVMIEGDDELSGLAIDINRMLETIQKTQAKVLASEARFRELAELLPLIIFEMDTAGNLQYVNRAGIEHFGITGQKILQGANIRHYLSPDNIDQMQRGLAAVMSGSKSTGEIYTLQKSDGSLMRAIVYTSLIYRDGNIKGYRGVLLDISERIRLEEALTESEEYLQSLIRSVRIGIIVIDAETHRIIDVNPAALAMIGTTKDAVINQVCHNVICPAEVGRCPITDLNQSVDNAEHTLVTLDGREISIIKYVVPVMLHGKPCLLETFIDNSYRKQIELKLAESEEKYRALTENSADLIFSLDMAGIFTYISPQINKYGFLAEEIIGKSLISFVHPEDGVQVQNDLARDFKEGAQFHSLFRILDKWGNVHWFDENGTLRLDQSGKPLGIYGVLRDDTERKRAEDAIELANKKLNLMNNITRHDILNTITGLLGCVDMANATQSAEERIQLLTDIKDLTRIIQRQIAFTKEYQEVGVHLPLWQNLDKVITRMLENFKNSGLNFVVDLENTEIYADPLLEKVFYNLVDNSIRYGDTVTTIKFELHISDKGLSIICDDDGAGIPPGDKMRIFERGVGRNTGMGLFLTREILGITGITIVENGVFGKGARFEIHIPRGTFRFVR